jgi:hypothetical protein
MKIIRDRSWDDAAARAWARLSAITAEIAHHGQQSLQEELKHLVLNLVEELQFSDAQYQSFRGPSNLVRYLLGM